jgi:hypothetical protein
MGASSIRTIPATGLDEAIKNSRWTSGIIVADLRFELRDGCESEEEQE